MLVTYLVLVKADPSRAFSNFLGEVRDLLQNLLVCPDWCWGVLWCVFYIGERSNVCYHLHCCSCFSGVIAGGTLCLPLWDTRSTIISALFLSLWSIIFKQLTSCLCFVVWLFVVVFGFCLGFCLFVWVSLFCVLIPSRCVLFLSKLFCLTEVAWFYYIFKRLLALFNSKLLLACNIFWLCAKWHSPSYT